MALTDRAIRAAKPAEKVRHMADGGGLVLRVATSGTKTFMFRRRVGGKDTWKVLGHYPSMSLADARHAAAQETERRTKGAADLTLSDLWTQYHAHLQRTVRRPDLVRHQIEKHILPALGTRRLIEIQRADLMQCIADVVEAGTPRAAESALTYTKMLFSFAVMRGFLDTNPVQMVSSRALSGPRQTRDRALSVEELRALVRWLWLDPGNPTGRLTVAMLLLTGLRKREVSDMSLSEVKGVWWTIPAERMKGRKTSAQPHQVYLGPMARRVLRWAVQINGVEKPFQGSRTLANYTIERAVRDIPLEPCTVHDLRRTVSTHLSEIGVQPHIVEKLLAHKMPGVMAVYNRAQYLPERREAYRLWARYLRGLRRG